MAKPDLGNSWRAALAVLPEYMPLAGRSLSLTSSCYVRVCSLVLLCHDSLVGIDRSRGAALVVAAKTAGRWVASIRALGEYAKRSSGVPQERNDHVTTAVDATRRSARVRTPAQASLPWVPERGVKHALHRCSRLPSSAAACQRAGAINARSAAVRFTVSPVRASFRRAQRRAACGSYGPVAPSGQSHPLSRR